MSIENAALVIYGKPHYDTVSRPCNGYLNRVPWHTAHDPVVNGILRRLLTQLILGRL